MNEQNKTIEFSEACTQVFTALCDKNAIDVDLGQASEELHFYVDAMIISKVRYETLEEIIRIGIFQEEDSEKESSNETLYKLFIQEVKEKVEEITNSGKELSFGGRFAKLTLAVRKDLINLVHDEMHGIKKNYKETYPRVFDTFRKKSDLAKLMPKRIAERFLVADRRNNKNGRRGRGRNEVKESLAPEHMGRGQAKYMAY